MFFFCMCSSENEKTSSSEMSWSCEADFVLVVFAGKWTATLKPRIRAIQDLKAASDPLYMPDPEPQQDPGEPQPDPQSRLPQHSQVQQHPSTFQCFSVVCVSTRLMLLPASKTGSGVVYLGASVFLHAGRKPHEPITWSRGRRSRYGHRQLLRSLRLWWTVRTDASALRSQRLMARSTIF